MAQFRWVCFGIALGLTGCASAGAGTYDPRPFIESCRRAATEAAGPATEVETYAALRFAGSGCRLPLERLPALWDSVPADERAISPLYNATLWAGEGPALFHRLVAIAADLSRPHTVRAHVLAVLMPFFQPASVVTPEAFSDTVRRAVLGTSSHASYRASSSIRPADKDSARRTLRRAQSSTTDRRQWHSINRFLWHSNFGLDRWDPEAARRCEALVEASKNDALLTMRDETTMSAYELARCTKDGPAVLAGAWMRVTEDSASLQLLLSLSQTLRDRRIVGAALTTAADQTRPEAVRFAALHTLATLADPAMYSMSTHTWARNPSQCYGWWGWHHHHAVQEDGAEPLPEDAAVRIRSSLREIGNADHAPRVRRLAHLLARCIRVEPNGPPREVAVPQTGPR
jgi:hypothetical protein